MVQRTPNSCWAGSRSSLIRNWREWCNIEFLVVLVCNVGSDWLSVVAAESLSGWRRCSFSFQQEKNVRGTFRGAVSWWKCRVMGGSGQRVVWMFISAASCVWKPEGQGEFNLLVMLGRNQSVWRRDSKAAVRRRGLFLCQGGYEAVCMMKEKLQITDATSESLFAILPYHGEPCGATDIHRGKWMALLWKLSRLIKYTFFWKHQALIKIVGAARLDAVAKEEPIWKQACILNVQALKN